MYSLRRRPLRNVFLQATVVEHLDVVMCQEIRYLSTEVEQSMEATTWTLPHATATLSLQDADERLMSHMRHKVLEKELEQEYTDRLSPAQSTV